MVGLFQMRNHGAHLNVVVIRQGAGLWCSVCTCRLQSLLVPFYYDYLQVYFLCLWGPGCLSPPQTAPTPGWGTSLQDSLGWAAPRGGGTTDTDAPATVGQLITRALGPEAGALGSLPGFAAS